MATKQQKPAKTETSAKTTKQDDGGGKTQVEQGGESAPRLPHEHDQSSDSQQNQDGNAPQVGRQALEDVERGLVDTDRGPVTDKVYNDKVKP